MPKTEDKYTSPLMQLVVEQLKKNKKATYADIKSVAAKKNLTLFPITFGRAKSLLGLVPMAKRGRGRAARAKAAAAGTAVKRGPGRPRSGSSVPVKRGPGRPKDPASKSARIQALLGTRASAAQIAKQIRCSVNLVYAVKNKTKRGPGRPRSASAGIAQPMRGPGRPRKIVNPVDSLDALVSSMKQSAQSSTTYRHALEQVFELVGAALRG